ncbi:MAG: PhoH family protein [Chitinophagales bacterium]|nr:PhoH family protein [Chitinophagales bacterium]
MSDLTIDLDGVDPIDLFGINNSKLKLLKKAFPRLRIVSRGHVLKAAGSDEELQRLKSNMDSMIEYISRYGSISNDHVENLLFNGEGLESNHPVNEEDIILYGTRGTVVKAKTDGQRELVKASEESDVLFAIGPAGTGKTYTAVAIAVNALKNRTVKRIILTRPAVEAGESLGFLPGDLKEKIDPYLRPLYDALDDMIPPEKLNDMMYNRVIEIAPLAYMRGRTLDKAFIILDEAQNATSPQLKMFLTRIGATAKCIITGDLTQIDLPKSQKSGLFPALNILSGIPGIGTVYLTERDVIRHKLVKKIIAAYANYQKELQKKENDEDNARNKSAEGN